MFNKSYHKTDLLSGTGNMATAVTVAYTKIADLQRLDMIIMPCRDDITFYKKP